MRRVPFILTNATGATVVRWATRGKKRLRNKYLHARVLCRIVNPRHGGPVLALAGHEELDAPCFGPVGSVKLGLAWRWGCGAFSAMVYLAKCKDVQCDSLVQVKHVLKNSPVQLRNISIGAGDSEMSMEACCPRRSRRKEK